MVPVKIYSQKSIGDYLRVRTGESRVGEAIGLVKGLDELPDRPERFVLLGIPEDIGVRANYGNQGTATAWGAFLSVFLNLQDNSFCNPQDILLIGEIDTRSEMDKADLLDATDPNYAQKLGDLVSRIDQKVTTTVSTILKAGKTPVIIGGGHNNCLGNLAALSEAIGKPVNALNIDAHTDLRHRDYRHSGNGFSYALDRGFLNRYAVFGLHRNFTPSYIFEDAFLDSSIRLFNFEELGHANLAEKFNNAIDFVKEEPFGLELDCDAIVQFPSSASSPIGFELREILVMIRKASGESNCNYFHVCEAIASETFRTGKALSYLVCEFIFNRGQKIPL